MNPSDSGSLPTSIVSGSTVATAACATAAPGTAPPVFDDPDVRVDAPRRVGVVHEHPLLDPGDQAGREVALQCIGGINDEPLMHVAPVLFEPRVHARKGALHGHAAALVVAAESNVAASRDYTLDSVNSRRGTEATVTRWSPAGPAVTIPAHDRNPGRGARRNPRLPLRRDRLARPAGRGRARSSRRLTGARRAGVVTDSDVGPRHLAPLAESLAARRHRRRHPHPPRRRGAQDDRAGRPGLRHVPVGPDRALHPPARPGRRRRRRPDRLRRRHRSSAACRSSRCRRRCWPWWTPRSAARPASTTPSART